VLGGVLGVDGVVEGGVDGVEGDVDGVVLESGVADGVIVESDDGVVDGLIAGGVLDGGVALLSRVIVESRIVVLSRIIVLSRIMVLLSRIMVALSALGVAGALLGAMLGLELAADESVDGVVVVWPSRAAASWVRIDGAAVTAASSPFRAENTSRPVGVSTPISCPARRIAARVAVVNRPLRGPV
jgi:hypothetical protein